MKGDVLHYDDNLGTGLISGVDGNRYTFTRADMKQLAPVSRGTKVDFDFEGKAARDIFIDAPATAAAPAASPAAHATMATAPVQPSEPKLGLWGYFTRAYTAKYAKFSGRARRKEYWGVAIFAGIISAILYGVIIWAVMQRFSSSSDAVTPERIYYAIIQTSESVYALVILLGFYAVSILPFLGLLFRRVHDIGWSGWIAAVFILMGAIGYFVPPAAILGGVAMLLVAFFPGQPGDNKYGPSPR